MEPKALAMMIFGFLLLYGGFGFCVFIAWRHGKKS